MIAPLTATANGRSVLAVGGVETSGGHNQGARRAHICAAFFTPGIRVFSLRREGGEYNTLRGNKPALTFQCLGLVCLGFYPPATSAAVESSVGGVHRQSRIFDMADAAIASATPLAITDLKTINIDEAPRIRDMVLAERLGFERPRAIRQIIERNRAELEGFGPLATACGKSRGQNFTEFWLLEEQALVICALSRTPAAIAVRRQIITVYTEWRRQQSAPAARIPALVAETLDAALHQHALIPANIPLYRQHRRPAAAGGVL